jgi:hypothetical protein
MIAFNIALNGRHVCTAGIRDFGVLTAMVTWVHRKPEQRRGRKRIEKELAAEVAGLDSVAKEHVKWLRRRLRIGDRLAIEIVKSDSPDTPKRRYRDDPRIVERAKRRYFERLKKEYATDSVAASKRADRRR